MSNENLEHSAATACSTLKWTKEDPWVKGWYWFQVGDDSPSGMTRLLSAIVYVGDDGPNTSLRCVFPNGTFTVGRMGGRWAGPIPQPKE